MKLFSYHLVRTSPACTLRALMRPPTSISVPGLVHAECTWKMRLGAPILSPDRAQLSQLTMFAAWDEEAALEHFLRETRLGQVLATGWHVRMEFLRRWGLVVAFEGLPETAGTVGMDAPVVAVTLARMKLAEVPRFIKWGRPVEELVRDAPGKTLALASMRPPNTVSTFTIWETQQAMLDMVQGHSPMERADRHAVAMIERDRRDFHHEFTTLRFKPVSEHGRWDGEDNLTRLT